MSRFCSLSGNTKLVEFRSSFGSTSSRLAFLFAVAWARAVINNALIIDHRMTHRWTNPAPPSSTTGGKARRREFQQEGLAHFFLAEIRRNHILRQALVDLFCFISLNKAVLVRLV